MELLFQFSMMMVRSITWGCYELKFVPNELNLFIHPETLFHFTLFSFLYKFIYFNWNLITLQYCIGFAIHQHESATGIHVLPILNPPPPSLPVPSLWVVSVHQPQASSIMHRTWAGYSFWELCRTSIDLAAAVGPKTIIVIDRLFLSLILDSPTLSLSIPACLGFLLSEWPRPSSLRGLSPWLP